MLFTAIAFFSLAAILGMILISFVLRGKSTPKGIVLMHGPIAAIGLFLLYSYAFYDSPKPIASLILFTIAALGGFVLLYRDLTGKILPKWLAALHGLIAITGFAFLLVFAFAPNTEGNTQHLHETKV